MTLGALYYQKQRIPTRNSSLVSSFTCRDTDILGALKQLTKALQMLQHEPHKYVRLYYHNASLPLFYAQTKLDAGNSLKAFDMMCKYMKYQNVNRSNKKQVCIRHTKTKKTTLLRFNDTDYHVKKIFEQLHFFRIALENTSPLGILCQNVVQLQYSNMSQYMRRNIVRELNRAKKL